MLCRYEQALVPEDSVCKHLFFGAESDSLHGSTKPAMRHFAEHLRFEFVNLQKPGVVSRQFCLYACNCPLISHGSLRFLSGRRREPMFIRRHTTFARHAGVVCIAGKRQQAYGRF